MNKRIVCMLTFLFLTGCSVHHNTELEKSMTMIIQDQNISEINIASLTDFDWTKAYLFEPYTTDEMMAKQLSTYYKDASNIDRRDDIYLLVFLNEDKVIHYTEIPRYQSNFSLYDKEYMTPSDAVIHIERFE